MDKKIEKYKNITDLKKALKRLYDQGTAFASDNEKAQKLLEEIGVVVVCGGAGAAIGFSLGGPPGALAGGALGVFAGLVVIEKIKIKSIHLDHFGRPTVTFV